jgi:ribosomal-protein-alanine N-acetyltransferase
VRSQQHRVMEICYVLCRAAWANGYLPEAGRCLLRHAFETTNVHRIYAPIFAENTKSRRAAEKMGMKLDGVLRSALFFKGRRWDEAIYSVLKGEI